MRGRGSFWYVAALSTATLLFVNSTSLADPRKTDSEQVSKLLSEVRSEALLLRTDAERLGSFTQSSLSWESYANELSQIRSHVNKAGSLIQQMNDLRVVSSRWQKIAIDRLTPLLNELANNTQLTISKLNAAPNSVHSASYRKYVSAHQELATQVATMVGNFVDYERTKAKFEALTRKLELPEEQQ